MLAITGASAALALSEIPFEKTIAGVRVGLVDGQYVINPTFEQRKESKLDLVVAGSKDGLVMVEAGAKEVTEEQVVEALEAAHAAIKQIVAGDRRPREGSRQEEADGREEGNRPRVLPRGRREGARAAHRGDADPRQARELRPRRPGARRSRSRRCPKARSSGRSKPRQIFKELKEKVLRDEVLDARRPARRPQVRRSAADLDRNQRAAAHPRLGRLHPRRDAGARHLHARHRRRCAEDRELRGRDVEELHAPLQLPALLGRRGRRSCAAPAAARSATARSPSAR